MDGTAARSTKGRASTGPTFAVAFGGGGARGLAHIHVIEALDELGIRPVAIAGSSIGAIMGAGMAAGMTGRDIHDYARSILARRSEVAARMWRARPINFADVSAGGVRFGQLNVERILRAFLPEQVPQNFAELTIPLSVTATDYYGHALAVFDPPAHLLDHRRQGWQTGDGIVDVSLGLQPLGPQPQHLAVIEGRHPVSHADSSDRGRSTLATVSSKSLTAKGLVM